MKVRKQKEIPLANRIFTDREEPRAVFWKNYETYRQSMSEGDNDIRVLSYYGIGGIGKSRLLKQLMTEMDERISKPKYVYFDFNIHQESRAVLESLKNKLSSEFGFKFPLFELGVYNYAKKIGEDVNAPEIKAYIDKSPFLSAVFSVAGMIPVAGTIVEALKLMDQAHAYAQTYLNNHRWELAQIEYKEANELYSYLPYLFSKDMANNLEKAKEPLVIFLDTYEQVVNEMSSVGEPLNDDLWIRGEDGLVQNIPNVLWVIAGREKLKWERFDPEWNSALEQHILGNLAPVDSESFLTSAGVGGAVLRQQLYELTDGTPVYLDLCVDRFHDMTSKGIVPTIENFGDNLYSLIERFVRYMDDNKKDIVYVLACMQQWDDELITAIAGSVLANFSISTYERVKDFSFIIESGDGIYNIHQTVGSVLLSNCPEAIKSRTARKALEYYQKTLENEKIIEEDYVDHLQNLIHFGLMLYEAPEELRAFYRQQVSDRLRKLGRVGKFRQALSMLKTIYEKAKCDEASLLHANILFDWSCLSNAAGMYQEALSLAEKSVGLYNQLYGENHINTMPAIRLLASSLDVMKRYEEAMILRRRVLKKYADSLGDEDIDTIAAVGDLANSLNNLKQHEEALRLQTQVLEKSQKTLGENHSSTILAMSNMANTLYYLRRYKDALEIERQVLKKRQEVLGDDHPDTILIMNNLAISLKRLDHYEEALQLQTKVLEKYREILGNEHPRTISAMLGLARAMNDVEQYEEALDLLKKALATSKKVWGDDHPQTISIMSSMADTFGYLKLYENVIELYEQILVKQQQSLGENHPDTISAMRNLAFMLHHGNRTDDALGFYRQIFKKCCKVFGEDHPDTIKAMQELLGLLKESGGGEEAVELCRLLLEKNRKLYGEDHAQTIWSMDTLASLLKQIGEIYEYLGTAYQPVFQEVSNLYLQIFEKRLRILGENHPRTLSSMHNLAQTLFCMEQYEEALSLCQKELEKRLEYFGKNQQDTVFAMELQVRILEKQGRIKEAGELKHRAEEAHKKTKFF